MLQRPPPQNVAVQAIAIQEANQAAGGDPTDRIDLYNDSGAQVAVNTHTAFGTPASLYLLHGGRDHVVFVTVHLHLKPNWRGAVVLAHPIGRRSKISRRTAFSPPVSNGDRSMTNKAARLWRSSGQQPLPRLTFAPGEAT